MRCRAVCGDLPDGLHYRTGRGPGRAALLAAYTVTLTAVHLPGAPVSLGFCGMSTRILAVEDDERIRTAVRLALEDEGWEVAEAATGEDALQHFQNQPVRRRADRHHAAGHRRLRGVPLDPPQPPTCRS